MYSMFWIFTSTLLYSASLAVELPERPHSIFDEFSHKFNVKSGETSKHTDKDTIPRLENLFMPSNPSHSRVPELPLKYHGFKENNEHSPFHPDTLLPTILKEGTLKPASSSSLTREFDNPKYEHSDVVNKGVPERPHSIFDEFFHKFNVKSGETSKHTDKDRILRLENLFMPSHPSHSRVPELPSKYHGFKENNEHSPFHPDTLPPKILKEGTHKPASSSPPTQEFDNPKYEHSDVINKGVSERPYSIFDEFFHKFNVKSGETSKHTDNDRIPPLENLFMPSNHSKVPELPSKYHGFKENNEHSPFHPDTLPHTILKERTHKPASSSPPTQEFDNPKYEHSDVMNKGDEISREARENFKDLEQFKNILDQYEKQLFSTNEMSHRLSPHNLLPSSGQIRTNNEDRKHFGNSLNEFALKNHPTRNNFAERSKSSLVPSRQLPKLPLNPLETKVPLPGFGDLEHKLSHVKKTHEPSQSRDEFQRIKDFLSKPVGKFEYPNHRRIINDEKNPTAVELDFSETNKTDMDRKVLRTLVRELPILPDFQEVYKLKLLVKPPNDSNTTFVRDFVIILRNITTNLIPDAITAAKITAFKKNNKRLSMFQVNLYIKYLNRWTVGKSPTTNDSYDFASEKILNNKNETIIELEENKNNTMEIAKINLDKLTSNYKESLKSILNELLDNTTKSDGFNKSIVLISIKLPNHRAFDLTDTLFKTAQSVMCAVVPDLITFDNLKLPRRKNSPRIEILIPIQETNFLHHLSYLNLTHSNGNLYMEISKRVPRILNAVTRCRPDNSTINFNFTMLLPQNQSTEAIRNILREVTNIARKVVPHHRIYIETQTSTLPNNLKLQLNITMKPSEIYAYHKGIEKKISIDLRRSGASMVPKIRRILPKLIREIEESSNPVSLIFNISFPLGMNKDFVRNEILALITILEDAIPVEYGTIANVILQITVLPTEALRENEIIRNIKLHGYEESLMRTTKSIIPVEQSNTTESSTSSSNGQNILERSTEESSVTKHSANVLYPSFKRWPGITANRNSFWNHQPKVSYPRWRTPSTSSHKIPSIFEKPHLIPLRQSIYRRRHLPQPMFKNHEKIYKTPLHSYWRNEYPNFRNFFHQSPKNDLNNWRRPVNHANFWNFPSNIRWPRITTMNPYISESKATPTSHSNSVENWAKSTEAPSSAVYHTPGFHFPIWQKLPSTSRRIPNSFEEIPVTYRRLNFPSHKTSRYDRFAHQTIRNEEYRNERFREPWKFYRHFQNKYDQFNKFTPHLEKHSSRHISTSWKYPLYQENIKNFSSRLRGPSETSTTPESTTLKTEASTNSFSNAVENWTESEEISSSSVVYHTPSYEISTENSNGQPQKFYRYLIYKYHKFHKLPHHLKKQIWKKIQAGWKKATNEKKIRKFLSKIPWPRIQNSKTSSTTFETSPSTSSSRLFENSSESEFSTTPNVLEKLVSRSSSNAYRSLSQHPFIPVQSTPRIAPQNRKYNHNRKRKHSNFLQKYKNFESSTSIENFNISSTYFNSLFTSPTSETTLWSTPTTPSNPSTSSVENTHTISSEVTTKPTVLPSSSETETTMEVTSSETSSIENKTSQYLEPSTAAEIKESSNEYTTTYSTSNEATINNSPERTTSYSAYAKHAPNDFQVKEPTFFLPPHEISSAIPTSNERIKHVLSSTEINGAEEPNSNIIPENITPETAPFLDNGNFRKIPRFRQTKIKLTKPMDRVPKNFVPRKIKWPNVSTKENSLQNSFPNENSIQESLTSRTLKGEVIDKETSLQYFENGHFNVRKRTLNFSNSNSDMLSEIERNVLAMLGKNGNEPTILLFKVIPNEGMIVSDLRGLTEPLLSSLIADFPTSEINIVTKAYYNKNQEIKLMKMKIAINYSNGETTKNDNQLEENIYLVKYLKIIIHKILEHIEMNSSDQQISQFNFTIDCPSEVSGSFDSNLIQSSEAILSQILPYENVDITSGNIQNDSNISSCSMNVIITPIRKTNRIVWAPLIHLDDLNPDHLEYKIQHFVLEYLLNSSTSDQNISAVINFAFETNKVTSFDIIELENSIYDILNGMQITGKFLSTDARLELNNKKGIIIKMPFSVITTNRALLRYLKNSYKSKIANTKNVEPSGRISDLILED